MEELILGLVVALKELILNLAVKYPLVLSFVSAMGFLRMIFKPTFTFARAIVEATKTKSDDAVMDKVESSKITKAILYCLDFFASIKIK